MHTGVVAPFQSYSILFYSKDNQTTLRPTLQHLWEVSCYQGGFQTYMCRKNTIKCVMLPLCNALHTDGFNNN